MTHVPGHEDTTTARLPRSSNGIRAARESFSNTKQLGLRSPLTTDPILRNLRPAETASTTFAAPQAPLKPGEVRLGGGIQQTRDFFGTKRGPLVEQLFGKGKGFETEPGHDPAPGSTFLEQNVDIDRAKRDQIFSPVPLDKLPGDPVVAPEREGASVTFAAPTRPGTTEDFSGIPAPRGVDTGLRQTPLISGTGDDLTLTGSFKRRNTPEEAMAILRGGVDQGKYKSISGPITAESAQANGLRSRVAGAGETPSTTPTIADLLSGVSDVNLGGLQAAGALSTDLFNREQKGIRNRQEDRRIGAQERTAAATEIGAETKLQKQLQEGVKLPGFELTASRPDPMSLDPTNPSFLPATVKVEGTEFNISPEEEQAISTRARALLRKITEDPLTAGVSEEEAFNKAMRTATLDVIGDRVTGQ